ncbi:Predicted transcriptional regulator [Methylobacterium sp. 174MFSha1.1]|uniref:HVO_A0114 family putative DNA-binding protein n=1 Tax=Methylobacterium sp. 174MFSha1.1 TaxID=1502749 RepID=UPI0008E7D1F6|nr:helix-turn-helix domain-containing protein [Methylobacterium sp. 174MFSha1.1]SFU65824.1 Predicted transcriptional regulator [Methylobacterium sp. 174MFSha1.1]
MRTVTIGVSGIAEVQSRLSAAFHGEPQGAFISFASVELLWTVMTPQRWELLRALVGRDPLPLTALADVLGRDSDSVRADIDALRKAGIIESGSHDRISFPFDSVHVDFTMGRAA